MKVFDKKRIEAGRRKGEWYAGIASVIGAVVCGTLYRLGWNQALESAKDVLDNSIDIPDPDEKEKETLKKPNGPGEIQGLLRLSKPQTDYI